MTNFGKKIGKKLGLIITLLLSTSSLQLLSEFFHPTPHHRYPPPLLVLIIAGKIEFTHATQNLDHGQPESQRRAVGSTYYDTPEYFLVQ
jgi:hypothetical protein